MLMRCFTSETDILSMKLCYKVSLYYKFQIKHIYYPWCPHKVAQSNFVHDFANNAER